MRLDGELVRDDGAAVNWREFHAGAREILVKTVGGVALLDSEPLSSWKARHHDGRLGTGGAARRIPPRR